MKIALLNFCPENALPVCPTVNKECSRVQKITEGPTIDHRRAGGGLSTFTSHCADYTWQETSGHEVTGPGRRPEGPPRHHVTVPSAGRHILRSEDRRRLFRKQREDFTRDGGRRGARNRRRQGQNTHRSCDDETRSTPLKRSGSPPPASGQQRWQITTRLVSPTPAPRPRWRSSSWTERYRPPSAVFSPATSSPGRNRTMDDSRGSGSFLELPGRPARSRGWSRSSPSPAPEHQCGRQRQINEINLPNEKKEGDKKLLLRPVAVTPDEIFYIQHHPHQLLSTSCVSVSLSP